ncbi:MAG: hypothetical protein KC636_32785 [Myxococcales bacterium]|nr:hypothetical protein [Myxococcales bacterium]
MRTPLTLTLIASFLLSAAVACSEDPPAVDCATAEVPNYSEMTVWNSCIGCHSSELSGDARQNAPDAINFDNYEDAKINAIEAAHEVVEGEMPPGAPLGQADQDAINAWAQCGTPE